ncbi:unnamed protein product [Sphagnum balticum]
MNEQQLEDIILSIHGLGDKIEGLYEHRARREQKSWELNELFGALAKAQAEMETAGLTNANPFFKSKYADLAEIVKSSRPALTKHGLSVIQYIEQNEQGSVLVSMLGHASGQYITSQMPINPAKTDVQSLGSYITYLRRYSYAALVGVVVCDEDDDGESSMERAPKVKQSAVIDAALASQLSNLIGENNHLEKTICTKLGIKNINDIPQERYAGIVNWIKEQNKTA